ncbi:unnamed protein product [Umbelopsis ramanniana]
MVNGVIDFNHQSVEVPNSRKPGQTGVYRNAQTPKELLTNINPKVTTIYEAFRQGLKISRDRPLLGMRPIVDAKTGKRGPYAWQTYRQVSYRITNFGSGLFNLIDSACGEDYGRGSVPIGLWANNRPEWFIADMATAAYGHFSVALYDTLGPDTVEYVTNHAEIKALVTSADHIADLLKLKHKLPTLQIIISMDKLDDETPVAGVPNKSAIIKAWAEEKGIVLVDMQTLEAEGRKAKRAHRAPKPDDLACLMYTSGTTGVPKASMLSHRNFVSALSGSLYNLEANQDDINISYLPLAHIFGRITDLSMVQAGGRIGYYSGDVLQLLDDMQLLKPTFMASVPRLLNRIYARIASQTIEAPGITGVIARKAVAAKLENLNNGGSYTHAFWDRIIFSKVKQALGGHVRAMITGSAPIGKDVMQFLRIALCVDLREGYGATESCAACTCHNPGEYRAGHIGVPFPHNEIKLIDVPEMDYLSTDPYPRGEICARGPNIFLGYYKDEEKTRETVDSEGWLLTGDIGMIDERGCLIIIDRKKNIFKLAQGEYIAPEKIENVYAKNTLLAQIYLHGDSLQSSLVAIVVPDPEALNVLAAKIPSVAGKKLSFQELCKHPDVNAAILADMDKTGRKAGLRGFEYARKIHLESDPFSIENELLTPTMKVKRPQAAKYYQDQIKAMYDDLEKTTVTAKL